MGAMIDSIQGRWGLISESLKRSHRNWLRKRRRVRPKSLPEPFFAADSIQDLKAFFEGQAMANASRVCATRIWLLVLRGARSERALPNHATSMLGAATDAARDSRHSIIGARSAPSAWGTVPLEAYTP